MHHVCMSLIREPRIDHTRPDRAQGLSVMMIYMGRRGGSRIVLGFMACVALLVACSSSEDVARPSAEPTTVTVTTTVEVTPSPPPTALTEEDLDNATIPAGSCFTGIDGWDSEHPVQLRSGQGWGGRSEAEADVGILAVELLGHVDVDGDESDEMVVSLVCAGSAPSYCCAGQTSSATIVNVYRVNGGELESVATPYGGGSTAPGDESGPLPRGISEARLEDRVLVTTEHIYEANLHSQEEAGGDPSRDFLIRLQLRDGQWVEAD